jgi:hypothetical protein
MLAGWTTQEIAAFEDSLRRCVVALDDSMLDVLEPGERQRPAAAHRRQKAGVSSTRNV